MSVACINRKVQRKIFPFLISIFMISMVLTYFSCRGKSDSGKPSLEMKISRNLLNDFNISEKIYLPKYIDASDPSYSPYFVSGWYKPEKKLRWAKGKQSVLMFDALPIKGLNLEMECRSIKSQDSKKQKVQIFLNSKQIEIIKMKPSFKVYRISLPKKLIREGKNILTFEYHITESPADLLNTKDRRLLSVAFKYFKFFQSGYELSKPSKPFLQKKSGEIIHFPKSTLVTYLKNSTSENLEVKISRLSKNLKAHLKITSDKGPHKHIVFKKSGLKRIPLQNFSSQYLRLVFYLEKRKKHLDSSQDFAVWSAINLLEPARKNKLQSQLKNKLQPQLNELYNKLYTKKFDVVYIVFDAFHVKHSSLYGYHRKTTPFLEKIGKQGIVFQNFYANSPYTLASTGTLFTSRYPHEHGLVEKETKLNSSFLTIPEILSDHSISSFLLTGHPWFSEDWGLSRGFTKVYFKRYNKKDIEFTSSLNTLYSGNKADKQKFIYIHANPPHAPYLPPRKFRIFPSPENITLKPTPQNFRKIESGEIKATDDLLDYIESMYDANVLYADSLAQSIYEFFKKNNLLDQTILVFTSDHGDACKMQHGKFGHNTTLFQEMVHIPFVVVFPESMSLSPTRPQIPSSVVDAPTTILNLFGITEDYGLKGKNLIPFIFSPELKDSHVFLENLSGNLQQKGIIEHPYKFISSPKKEMLFDIINDYSEKTNLLSERPVTSGYFRQLIKSYSCGQKLESERIDLEKIDKETLEKLKSLGYIK
jgi:arylsulfatase A-like enzyme